MAKKIAVSANHLIIDIPVGKTMKVKYERDALKIKKKFEDIAKRFGIKIYVDLNSTQQPAGNGVGPFLEALDVLKILEQAPTRPMDLETRSIRLAGKLLDMCFSTAKIKKNGEDEANRILKSGEAFTKFKDIVEAQYGNPNISWTSMKHKALHKEIKAAKFGKIKGIQNLNLNTIAKILGAPSDIMAGISLLKRRNDTVEKNEPYMTLHSTSSYNLNEAIHTLEHFPVYIIEQ